MPPDAAHDPSATLEALARARFTDLTEAELKLLRAAPQGEFAICGPNMNKDDPANDPAKATDWGKEREIRADLIRRLCVDRQAKELVDPRGIRVHGARITGPLDLSNVPVPFPMTLRRCHLMGPANLHAIEIPALDLQGTWARSIQADSAVFNGNVFFRNGFHAEGEVRLPRAQVGGTLDCSAGAFKNPPQRDSDAFGKALNLDGTHVKGDIFLCDGFRAEGQVRLLGAQIGGSLYCTAATFTNPSQQRNDASGYALSADGAVVKGDVFLRNGFRAEGEVRLLGVEIAGDLDCSGGTFIHPPQEETNRGGKAISADGIGVKGHVFMGKGFHAEGDVRFLSAHVGGQMSCRGGTFHGLLTAESAAIEGPLFWTDIVPDPQQTKINLASASVGVLVDDVKSWPAYGNLILDGFTYERIIGGPKDSKSRLDWLARQDPFAPQPYRQLAKVLRGEGDDTGARQVLFEMERRRRGLKVRTWYGRLWSGVLRWTVGYGYYPGLALRWLALFAILGTALFWGGFSAGSLVPTDKDAYCRFKADRQLPAHYERFHASVYSLENSFPLVKLGQVDRWQPDPDPQWERKPVKGAPGWLAWILSPGSLRWFRWAQVCLGWFFATMGVAAVTGIVRKD